MTNDQATLEAEAPAALPIGEGIELTIVMPCLNEAETLATCIQKARLGLEKAGVRGEVLVADNGSTDGSVKIAEQEGARVVNVKDKGYRRQVSRRLRSRHGLPIAWWRRNDLAWGHAMEKPLDRQSKLVLHWPAFF